jgi:tetratricopeptide (TPR) repeat protein
MEGRYPEAIDRFLQAATIESIGPFPLFWAASGYINQGFYAVAESLAAVLAPHRDRYTEWEQYGLDWLVSVSKGDQIAEYETASTIARMAPGDTWLYLAGTESYEVNRPGEAVFYLTRISPTSPARQKWYFYWTMLAASYHMLGNHRDELAVAREGRELFPHSWVVRIAEVRALAALGRTEGILAVVEDSESLPYTLDYTPAYLMRFAGLELSESGNEEEASMFFERALQWYRSQSEADQETLKFSIAWTLYRLQRWEEAREILEVLPPQSPSRTVEVSGLLGRLAARRGDREAALEYQASLGDLSYFGNNRYEQAAIAALLGEKETAVSLLRRSFQEGRAFGLTLHTDMDFFSLRDFGPFREWLEPDG